MDEKYYTVNEIAERFGVTRTTVYDWMNRGLLEWVMVGPRRRVTETAVQHFLKKGTPRMDSGATGEVQSPEKILTHGLAPVVMPSL